MNILNRNASAYLRRIPHIPVYLYYFLKCAWLFSNPIEFLKAYITRQPIAGGVVKLRSGLHIYLSDHPHDPITVFVIFVRKDYGDLPSDSVIIDIGANIGVFALYAIHQGANKVFAYEPNSASFQCLQKNIERNGLALKISAHQLAVTSKPDQQVKFPVASSVYNSVLANDSDQEYEIVNTTSLDRIAQSLQTIDLAKIDCEGGEYDILFNSHDVLNKIQQLKLEYHNAQLDHLRAHLGQFGLKVQLLKPDSPVYGNIWFNRA
jgi:FkbM family methyltransferase